MSINKRLMTSIAVLSSYELDHQIAQTVMGWERHNFHNPVDPTAQTLKKNEPAEYYEYRDPKTQIRVFNYQPMNEPFPEFYRFSTNAIAMMKVIEKMRLLGFKMVVRSYPEDYVNENLPAHVVSFARPFDEWEENKVVGNDFVRTVAEAAYAVALISTRA